MTADAGARSLRSSAGRLVERSSAGPGLMSSRFAEPTSGLSGVSAGLVALSIVAVDPGQATQRTVRRERS